MREALRTALGITLPLAGIAAIAYATYLQYASLPEEHTRRQLSKRLAIGLAGIVLILLGSRLLR